MPLEDLTGPDKFLDALNPDWPLDDDERPEGDNHIRGLKNVIVNTFGPLSAPFEAQRAMLWDLPADGQDQVTAAAAMGGGSTAQRPPNPSLYAWRWNSDAQTGGWILEHWSGTVWTKSAPSLAVQNFYKGHQDLLGGAAADPWSGVKALRWAAADGEPESALLRSKFITDPAPGPGEAEVQMWAHIAGTLKTVLSLTAAGADFQNIGAVSLDGKPLMTVDPNYDSGATAFSAGQTVSFTHGLGRKPMLWRVMLECTAMDAGYGIGDVVDFGTVCGTNDTQNNFDNAMSSAYQDNDTEIKVRISGSHIALANAVGAFTKINMASWALRCLAW